VPEEPHELVPDVAVGIQNALGVLIDVGSKEPALDATLEQRDVDSRLRLCETRR
jgi:hypothetical protein